MHTPSPRCTRRGHSPGLARGLLLALAPALACSLLACGGRVTGNGPSQPGDGGNPAPRVIVIAWVLDRVTAQDEEPPRTAIALSLTDETGSARSESLGEVVGGCAPWGPQQLAQYPQTLLGLRCFHAGAGAEFRVVRSGANLVILRMLVDEQIDDSSFEEFRSVPIPIDAKVRVGP